MSPISRPYETRNLDEKETSRPRRAGFSRGVPTAATPATRPTARRSLRARRQERTSHHSPAAFTRNFSKFQVIRALALTGLLGLEPLVQLGSVVAVHVDLGEHREIDVVVVGDEGTDFFGGARLLLAELVAREAEDTDPVVVMMKRTQTCVLRRDASSGGDVDDEAGLIGEVREDTCSPSSDAMVKSWNRLMG